jgi:hypothetical protein
MAIGGLNEDALSDQMGALGGFPLAQLFPFPRSILFHSGSLNPLHADS